MNTMENMARLPKWAQRRIEKLESDVAYYTAKLTEGPDDSDTFADPHILRQPLGKGALVEFALTKHDDGSSRDYIQARLDEKGFVEIRASRRLKMLPQASNVIHVTNEAF